MYVSFLNLLRMFKSEIDSVHGNVSLLLELDTNDFCNVIFCTLVRLMFSARTDLKTTLGSLQNVIRSI